MTTPADTAAEATTEAAPETVSFSDLDLSPEANTASGGDAPAQAAGEVAPEGETESAEGATDAEPTEWTPSIEQTEDGKWLVAGKFKGDTPQEAAAAAAKAHREAEAKMRRETSGREAADRELADLRAQLEQQTATLNQLAAAQQPAQPGPLEQISQVSQIVGSYNAGTISGEQAALAAITIGDHNLAAEVLADWRTYDAPGAAMFEQRMAAAQAQYDQQAATEATAAQEAEAAAARETKLTTYNEGVSAFRADNVATDTPEMQSLMGEIIKAIPALDLALRGASTADEVRQVWQTAHDVALNQIQEQAMHQTNEQPGQQPLAGAHQRRSSGGSLTADAWVESIGDAPGDLDFPVRGNAAETAPMAQASKDALLKRMGTVPD